jgi:excisionase family DNA binding protein
MTINSFRSWIKREIESLDGANCDETLPSIGEAKQIALQLGLPDVVRCLATVTTTMLAASTTRLVLCECLAMLPTNSETLTPPQVAKMLSVNPDKVLNWIRKGELQAVNVTANGGRPKYRIASADLEAFKLRRTPRAKVKTKRARPSGKAYY